ncbi:MAG: FAD:protein FMN transferase [Paludibacteraceae bacterium]|nr:FAD:protein FMN transferase [Paludibacteraceae bacterium]MBQ4018650.1 FAD:protein FMN transferase [Paludibacteraceae bacterium]
MERPSKQHLIGALLGIGIAALLIWGWDNDPKPDFYHNEGPVFGTYYNIRYEATCDLEDSIRAALTAFDNSLSLFNPHSVLSAVNANRDTTTDAAFETMWAEAERVYSLSNGAFDITVAPLVNAFGFGRKSDQDSAISPQTIDSILAFVGFDKVQLVEHRVIKTDPRVQIDGGAVAKGQACDMIAEVLRANGCENYLVEIGGEIVAKGHNNKGEPWHIGITKPNLNNEGAQEELQEILEVSDICMATSGNYRNFYYDGTERRSHTIDPRTGWPVQHSVLSATVVSSTCMRADAMATACMVLGAEEALEMIARADDAACYLIVAEKDSLTVISSPNWEKMIK